MAHRILGGIYVSLIEPINAQEDLRELYGISHVMSVLPGPVPPYISEQYIHHKISITDEETTNLLCEIPKAVKFIDSALFPNGLDPLNKKHQGAILIHCAQGQSRSVSIVIAYLMSRYKLSYAQSLHAVTRKVVDARPNAGFAEQLQLFGEMGSVVDLSSAEYRHFLVQNSLRLDPSGSSLPLLNIYHREETGESNEEAEENSEYVASSPVSADIPQFRLRCKMCRHILASNGDIETHEPPAAESRQLKFIKNAPNSRRIVSVLEAATSCSHFFMSEPRDWMQLELSKQEIEGKFQCPKCEAKVGGYSWRGSRCSCGKWMIPALHLQAAKVDKLATPQRPQTLN